MTIGGAIVKRVLIFLLVIVLVSISLTACSQPVELPDGVEDEQFYKDMTKCVDLANKVIETQNITHFNELEQIMQSYWNQRIDSEERSQTKEEWEIYDYIYSMYSAIRDHIKLQDMISDKDELEKEFETLKHLIEYFTEDANELLNPANEFKIK